MSSNLTVSPYAIAHLSTSFQNGSAQHPVELQLPSKRNRLPPAFIVILVILCAVVLLLLLAFWCAYERRSRHKALSDTQLGEVSYECSSSIEHRDVPEAPESTHVTSLYKPAVRNRGTMDLICYPFTRCFQRCLHLLPRAESNLTDSVACRTGPAEQEDSVNNEDPFSALPYTSSLCPTSGSFGLSHQIISAHISPSVSESPSLAHRRRCTPLPKLITPITSPSPLVETRTVLVQPTDSSCFFVRPLQRASEKLLSPESTPHFDNDSVFSSPILHAAHSHTDSSAHPATQCASECSSSKSSHPIGEPNILRSRSKGLLESRRGSHTSLKLPILPITSLAFPTEVTNRNGTSLDEDCNSGDAADHVCTSACHPPGPCSHSQTPYSEGQSTECFGSYPIDSSTNGDLPPDAQLDLSHPGTLCCVHACEPLKSLASSPSQYCHPCHYPRRYTRLRSIRSTHHRLHSHHHHRMDYASGSLSCQRNRELEQLMRASLPLTYEDLVTRLQSNASALFQEFWNIPMNHTSKRELPITGIGHKNRYQSILPNFSTRVVLPMIGNDPATTYINANYITGYRCKPKAFIATQGPMSHTVCDFWRMIWHTHAPAIVMITKLVEKHGVKCELYLPNTSQSNTTTDKSALVTTTVSVDDSAMSSGFTDTPISLSSPGTSRSSASPLELAHDHSDSGAASVVEHTSDSGRTLASLRERSSPDLSHSMALPGSSQTFGDIYVEIVSLQEFTCYTMRVLLLRRGSEERTVVHFWYTSWPDHSSPDTTPASANNLLQLVQAAESCRQRSAHMFPGNSVIGQQSPQLPDAKNVTLSPHLPETLGTDSEVREYKHALNASYVDSEGPLVVHCSAGLGRTGCFIALCIGCDQLRHEGVVDVLRIVSRLRLDRGGMVQTNEQYEFIHHALAAFQSFRSLPPDGSSTLR